MGALSKLQIDELSPAERYELIDALYESLGDGSGLDDELRALLDSRIDDIKVGRVEPVLWSNVKADLAADRSY